MSEDVLKRPSSLWHIHRWIYYWTLHWAYTPYAIPALICISFAESSFFPLPPDILLIPMVLAAPTRWWRIALYCTIASVLGGLAGYGIGVFAWETMGRWIVENVAHVQLVLVDGRNDIALPSYFLTTFGAGLGGEYLFQVYDKWNAWIVYIFGLTPLPYKLITITAGVAKVNLFVFTLASVAARATRFFVVAWLLKKWGKKAMHFIDRYFNILCVIFVALLIGGFSILKIAM
ncbi:MAG: DedA family protein [Proteobacteria bacterium]|jgi:membrane protein YqaA with SNARE-associated domain|nr:DedA family protein [Desulfocapsa sp.]MBU3945527.1 DedA family protein [Pseudomonadota bacterium]MCG2745083.1 DedA family protein [Desulfobacteraceae bacterium]MDO8946949.1 DedA family protein [Desulfocapsaceae bacterium]MBU3983867.1 DedA family protein [Pseudomonadota bacterium]